MFIGDLMAAWKYSCKEQKYANIGLLWLECKQVRELVQKNKNW